jgi:hypothetical protein
VFDVPKDVALVVDIEVVVVEVVKDDVVLELVIPLLVVVFRAAELWVPV